MQRFIFTFKMLYRQRSIMAKYLENLSLQTKSVLQLSADVLKEKGIKILVLDYDGVLAGHAVDTLDTPQAKWLKQMECAFGQDKVFILSNRPTLARKQLLERDFPKIKFFISTKKKPYPDGLLAIIKQTHCLPQEILMVDDRLLTGILAASLVGAQGLWVTPAVINIKQHYYQELFFIGLRAFDRWLIRLLK